MVRDDKVYIIIEFAKGDWRVARITPDLWNDIDYAILMHDEDKLYELVEEIPEEDYEEDNLALHNARGVVSELCDYEWLEVPMTLED